MQYLKYLPLRQIIEKKTQIGCYEVSKIYFV
jgi:hypothetical protein